MWRVGRVGGGSRVQGSSWHRKISYLLPPFLVLTWKVEKNIGTWSTLEKCDKIKRRVDRTLVRNVLSNLYRENEQEEKQCHKIITWAEIWGCFVPMTPCTTPYAQVQWLLRCAAINNNKIDSLGGLILIQKISVYNQSSTINKDWVKWMFFDCKLLSSHYPP